MAKTKDKATEGPAKKKKSAAQNALANTKTKSGKSKGKTADSSGFEALAKLASHPLVTDLLAVGAMAAVAAVAEHNKPGKSGKSASSAKAVKEAGKAAATAIGQRLLSEVTGLKKAAKAD